MSCGRFGQICLATSWKLVQHGQVGKFKVLGLLDSAVLEHGQVWQGLHFAVARSVLQSKPAVGTLCRLVMLQPCQVTALLGNKLETCSVSAAWAGWQV